MLCAHNVSLTHQGTDHGIETKLETNSEPPKPSHEMDYSKGDVCSTHVK